METITIIILVMILCIHCAILAIRDACYRLGGHSNRGAPMGHKVSGSAFCIVSCRLPVWGEALRQSLADNCQGDGKTVACVSSTFC